MSVASNDSVPPPLAAPLGAALDRLALGCRILEREGHACRTLGHASLRDPDGRGLWIKRWGISFGETREAADFVLIDFDGCRLGGAGRAPSEWPIHAGVMKQRPDIVVVVHSHPFYGRVFSAATEPLRPVSNSGNWFPSPPPRFETTSELIRDPALGDAIGERLGDNFAIFLRNHGVVFCGRSVEQAVLMGIQLEEACREHLLIAASGLAWDTPGEEERARKFHGSGQTLTVSFDHFARELDGGLPPPRKD
jgi:L-fuculose-phosphate aldolase